MFTKLVDLMQCAKPLIFENEEEKQFRYSIQGTCFLAHFRSRSYGITAKHCLRDRDPNSVRIRAASAELTFLHVTASHLLEGDDDSSDLVFFEIDPASTSPQALQTPHYLKLDYFATKAFIPKPSSLLALVGYPSAINSVDYDRFLLNTQGFSVDAHYDGPAESEHCSKLRFLNLAPIEHLDGLSGAPVFCFQKVKGKIYDTFFAGVFIRGTRQSNVGRFIDSAIVFERLKMFANSPI